ncbi:F-box protein [Prunus yedoensis var. nudiflora]|uniref:F-box protein n=1 Tax=Prunus yedoensis var. nudiflora TaxID=2094558 RepID=A0A314YDL4_PRUYE|nr:F-box protein [Prunus yedoensis var. nudiflora]
MQRSDSGGCRLVEGKQACVGCEFRYRGNNPRPSASDGGANDNNGVELPAALAIQPVFLGIASSSSTGRSTTSFKSRLGLLTGRNFVVCALRRWSSRNNS